MGKRIYNRDAIYLWNGTTGAVVVELFQRTSGTSFRLNEFLELSPSTLTGATRKQRFLQRTVWKFVSNMHVGGRPITNYSSIMNGYISNVRVAKGFQVRVAANCTVPSTDPLRYGARCLWALGEDHSVS